MSLVSAITAPEEPGRPWRSLHVFNLYRLIVVGAIAVIFFLAPPGATTFGLRQPTLFGIVISLWLAFVFASGFFSRFRWPGFRIQVYSLILIDIGLITILMYYSGGITSGLGALMLITIAASGILAVNKMPYVFASIATLAVLSTQSYSLLTRPTTFQSSDFTPSGLLGAGLFALALLSHTLSQRIRTSEALAEKRGEELANLAQVNELIIQQMETGILVVDDDGNIYVMNETAKAILGSKKSITRKTLKSLSPELDKLFRLWRSSNIKNMQPFRVGRENSEILPRFTRLGGSSSVATLMFLDDTARLSNQAQQIKLASLGRLTASIAHEIRNPLSAINHAGQLLGESESLPQGSDRLVEIILKQAKRLDTIVENILSLSRRNKFNQEELNLSEWLSNFHKKLLQEKQLEPGAILLSLPKKPLSIYTDKSHLEQVMQNICDNGIRYSEKAHAETLLEIKCTNNDETGEVDIDIFDQGSGINNENRDKLFEPFFTTESSGTGLGLFIARQLSELNQAHLQYIDNPDNGAHFRITFRQNIPTEDT
jgi:two-component system sensor histidine kinase PilS (NtrC family)